MAVCPVQCITMQADARGFLYPVIDAQKCLHCNKCQSVCPSVNKPVLPVQDVNNKTVFAAITRKQPVWQQSASGGAFYEICQAWGKEDPQNTWVFGATFEGLTVIHKGAILGQISLFHKSKYVQSEMRQCFRQIKELLDQGRKVIFSGTPCQVAGLSNFLKTDFSNLLCIDLICHGVGSPAVFKRYLAEHEQQVGKKIKTYTFRAKHARWGNFPRYQSQVSYQDNTTKFYVWDDYNTLFIQQLCLRDSCGSHCRYRHTWRGGDFTIADFNNFIRLFPHIKDARNHSTIICNTPKAHTLLKDLEQTMYLYPCSLETIVQYNPLLARSTPENPNRESFFKDFTDNMSIRDLVKKYVPEHPFSLVSWIKSHIPFGIKHFLFYGYKKLCK